MPWKDLEKKRAKQKEWYEKNKEAINARAREQYHLTKPPPKPKKPKRTVEERLAYQKEYYRQNRERILAQIKKWQAENPEYLKEWKEKNKERYKEIRKKWEANNRDRINEASKKRQQAAFEKDPEKVRAARRRNKARQKAKNPEKYREMTNRVNKKQYDKMVSELWDGYIRQLLCKHGAVIRMSAKDIPQELVEAKRLEIQIRRLLNEERD